MNPEKKVRSDAKLKGLPEERQAQIVAYAESDNHSLSDTVKWLAEDGIDTSPAAVSGFLSWYHVRAQFRQDEGTAEQLVEQLKREAPGLNDEQLDAIGQRAFSLMAIRRQDLDGFIKVRSARTRGQIEQAKLELRQRSEARLQEGLRLQREKFQRESCGLVIKWADDARVKAIVAATSSNEEKFEAIGQLMFGADWSAGEKAKA